MNGVIMFTSVSGEYVWLLPPAHPKKEGKSQNWFHWTHIRHNSSYKMCVIFQNVYIYYSVPPQGPLNCKFSGYTPSPQNGDLLFFLH